MRGTVKAINRNRGMVGVLTDGGDYSVFELLGGDEVEVGDDVSWKSHNPMGSDMLVNHSRGTRFEVFFQNHWVPPDQLRQQLLY